VTPPPFPCLRSGHQLFQRPSSRKQFPSTGTRAVLTPARTATTAELTYSRSKAALNAGVTFTVEYSDSLATNSWSASGVTETILTDDGTVETVKASIPSEGTILRRYVHLKVTAP
jgi:hypothetical protein